MRRASFFEKGVFSGKKSINKDLSGVCRNLMKIDEFSVKYIFFKQNCVPPIISLFWSWV